MVSERLKSHAKDPSKEFWTRVCVVTSKDANLTKAHVRYLESRLVELAKAADRATIANGNEPGAKHLPESDIADMEYFLSQLQVALPVVGIEFLRPKVPEPIAPAGVQSHPHQASTYAVPQPSTGTEPLKLVLNNKKHQIEAHAIELDGEITVLAGSLAVAKDETMSNSYVEKRLSLIKSRVLVPSSNPAHLVFTSNTAFRSPSEAAAVILNRSSNGRVEWRLAGKGQTLKDFQDSQIAG